MLSIYGNVPSGALLRSMTGHKERITKVTFSPDGSMIASSSWDKTVRLWNVASGDELQTLLTEHDNNVLTVAFSPDGKTLASGGWGQDYTSMGCRNRYTS